MADTNAAVLERTEAAARELGEAFGGVVTRVDAEHVDAFYLEHEEKFTLAGRTRFLRLMGIGRALYDNQTDTTRVSILAAQKDKVRAAASGVYVLRNTEEKYFFAAYASRVGWEDPRTLLALSEKDGWLLAGDDEKRGTLRFVKALEEGVDWSAAVFADIPYLYGRPVALSVGLYNAHLNASMRDAINTSGLFRFKMNEFAADDFEHAAKAIENVARANAGTYAGFLDALRRKRVLVEDARTLLRTAAAEKRLPKFQTSATLKYLDVLERGGEVDALAPQSLQTFRDLVDALALYGREKAKGSLVSQAKAETALFTVFFEDVYEEEGGELPAYIDLKEHVAQKA